MQPPRKRGLALTILAAAVFTPAKLDTAGAVLNGNSGSRFTH